ncbi:MAG: ribonuclease P protein component [Nitrospinota bacterium]
MRLEPLKGRRDFDGLFREGRRIHGPLFTLIALAGGGTPLRVGFSAPRALGGAVRRNRARRRLREALRRRGGPTGLGGRVVFLARESLLEARRQEIEAALDRAFAELSRAPQGARPRGRGESGRGPSSR